MKKNGNCCGERDKQLIHKVVMRKFDRNRPRRLEPEGREKSRKAEQT